MQGPETELFGWNPWFPWSHGALEPGVPHQESQGLIKSPSWGALRCTPKKQVFLLPPHDEGWAAVCSQLLSLQTLPLLGHVARSHCPHVAAHSFLCVLRHALPLTLPSCLTFRAYSKPRRLQEVHLDCQISETSTQSMAKSKQPLLFFQ